MFEDRWYHGVGDDGDGGVHILQLLMSAYRREEPPASGVTGVGAIVCLVYHLDRCASSCGLYNIPQVMAVVTS